MSAPQPLGEQVQPARVVLWSRPGCHLCQDALAIVADVCAERGVGHVERSILDDPAAHAAYLELIPVVVVDGRVVATWRVTPEDLVAALDGGR